MRPERYDVLAASPVRWTYEAHRQHLTGAAFAYLDRSAELRARHLGFGRTHPLSVEALEAVQEIRAYTSASMLHFGLAMENAFKARRFRDRGAAAQSGTLKHLRSDHDILHMARDCHIRLNDWETDVLRSITFAVKSSGKYPIAKTAAKQAEFSGRIYGPQHTAPLTERICVELLRDDRLVAIFKLGALSGIDDTA